MNVNVAIVASALLAATFMPNSGVTVVVPTAITLVYLFCAIVILRPSKFSGISTN
jgi:hypothetical protein